MPLDPQPLASLVRTTRLTLREVSTEDAHAFRDFLCDERYWRPLPIDPPSLSSIRAYLEQCERDAAVVPRCSWSLAAVETASGHVIGEGALRIDSRPLRHGEIGWGVDLARAGNGFGTEIAGSLLHLAFDKLGLHRIVARCRPDNAASRAIMVRLGFREEGVVHEDVFVRGEWWDSVQAAILDREWHGRQR